MLVMGFREVLRAAGFDAEPLMLRPSVVMTQLRNEGPCLVFLDAECEPAPAALDQVVRRTPQSRFVLAGTDITPEMLLLAVESGVHGVLSTRLAIEEAAQRISRIWHGERQFRFDSAPAHLNAPAVAAGADFDAEWMFGQRM